MRNRVHRMDMKIADRTIAIIYISYKYYIIIFIVIFYKILKSVVWKLNK